MRRRRHAVAGCVVGLLSACNVPIEHYHLADAPPVPTDNVAREIVDTKLVIDFTARTGTATITFGPSELPGATLEVTQLQIDGVKLAGAELPHSGGRLALAPSAQPLTVEIAYRWDYDEVYGASSAGYTRTWPNYCSRVFPCHSDPADGTTFTLALTGVPAGKTAIFPATIPAEAPAYQLAWSIDSYTELQLGTTTAGTQLSVWHLPGEAQHAMQGAAFLVSTFDWIERTIGSYRFGRKAGAVQINSLGGGGLEHHPFWHIGILNLFDAALNIREAAHGWFGDGVRIQCWEDLVLSEGTAAYLAGRALDVVAPPEGVAYWNRYVPAGGTIAAASKVVWPQACGPGIPLADLPSINDVQKRGALFYRAVALTVGAAKLDEALATFYAAHVTHAASMVGMLDTIHAVTGYDPAACADLWLRSTTTTAFGACP